MNVLKWLDKHFEEVVIGIMLIIMTLIMGAQVFCRYVIGQSLSWSEEITRYLFVWCGFISIALCARYKLALCVDQLAHMVPKKVAAGLRVFSLVVELVFYVYLIPYAFILVNTSFLSRRLSPAAQLPIWLVQLAPIVGFILGSIRCVQGLVLTFLSKKGTEASSPAAMFVNSDS
jgi:TRAP-type C4-dicarboxylate transport system permease small subunit